MKNQVQSSETFNLLLAEAPQSMIMSDYKLYEAVYESCYNFDV